MAYSKVVWTAEKLERRCRVIDVATKETADLVLRERRANPKGCALVNWISAEIDLGPGTGHPQSTGVFLDRPARKRPSWRDMQNFALRWAALNGYIAS